jgi:hypothetical protein
MGTLWEMLFRWKRKKRDEEEEQVEEEKVRLRHPFVWRQKGHHTLVPPIRIRIRGVVEKIEMP